MRAMRTDPAVFAQQGRVDETRFWFRLRCLVEGQSGWSAHWRRESRPWGPGRLGRFVQRGWRGELSVGDNRHRDDRSGDQFKRLTVKSSTMKGPINNEREGLPVRLRGDGAESRKAVQERYPELLLS